VLGDGNILFARVFALKRCTNFFRQGSVNAASGKNRLRTDDPKLHDLFRKKQDQPNKDLQKAKALRYTSKPIDSNKLQEVF
jgi:hypothetical protein